MQLRKRGRPQQEARLCHHFQLWGGRTVVQQKDRFHKRQCDTAAEWGYKVQHIDWWTFMKKEELSKESYFKAFLLELRKIAMVFLTRVFKKTVPVYLSWKISISRTNRGNPSQISSVFKNYSQRLLMPANTKSKHRYLINYLFYCSNCVCTQKAKQIFILHYLCVLSSASDWTHYSTRGSRYFRLLSVDSTEHVHRAATQQSELIVAVLDKFWTRVRQVHRGTFRKRPRSGSPVRSAPRRTCA